MTFIIKNLIFVAITPNNTKVTMSRCEQCIIREFSSLKALTRDELALISDKKNAFTVEKGQVLFNEGENLNGVFCIKEGICKLSKLSSGGKDSILKLAGKGELLGQRSMINDETSNLTAVAIEDMLVCFIPKKEVMQHFNDNNKFSMLITKDICNHLKDADMVIANHTHRTVKERLALLLLNLEELGGKDPETGVLNIVLSREDMANMLGTATESCIRLLSELKKEDIIFVSGRKIILKDHKALRNIAEHSNHSNLK